MTARDPERKSMWNEKSCALIDRAYSPQGSERFSRRHILQKPFGRKLPAKPHRPGLLQYYRTQRGKLRSGAGVVVEDRNFIRACTPGHAARQELLNFINGIPRLDSLLRGFPDIRRLIEAGDFLGVDNIEIRAADRFIIDFATLVTRVGTADGRDVHAFFHPLTIEDRIPCGGCGLNHITAFHGFAWSRGGVDAARQLRTHARGKFAAVFGIRTVDLNSLKIEKAAEEFQMGA